MPGVCAPGMRAPMFTAGATRYTGIGRRARRLPFLSLEQGMNNDPMIHFGGNSAQPLAQPG
jgi:hypothetical protein